MHSLSPADMAARKNIDVAVGILVGLRRCSVHEAFKELAAAAHQTGLPLGDTVKSLIALAHADDESAPKSEMAIRLWGDLFHTCVPAENC